MSDINEVLKNLSGTCEAEILQQMEEAYSNVSFQQSEWYKKSGFYCPEGCGECCRNFEPDLLECEAIYMAAWLIENQPEVAAKVANGEFPFPREKACQFWKEEGEYHCSIYGGRPFICRMFGACSAHSKSGEIVWKPCKFYPAEKLSSHNPPLAHRQYTSEEAKLILGEIPPAMSDFMESAVSINPDNHETQLIRDILPETIKRLLWILQMCSN